MNTQTAYVTRTAKGIVVAYLSNKPAPRTYTHANFVDKFANEWVMKWNPILGTHKLVLGSNV